MKKVMLILFLLLCVEKMGLAMQEGENPQSYKISQIEKAKFYAIFLNNKYNKDVGRFGCELDNIQHLTEQDNDSAYTILVKAIKAKHTEQGKDKEEREKHLQGGWRHQAVRRIRSIIPSAVPLAYDAEAKAFVTVLRLAEKSDFYERNIYLVERYKNIFAINKQSKQYHFCLLMLNTRLRVGHDSSDDKRHIELMIKAMEVRGKEVWQKDISWRKTAIVNVCIFIKKFFNETYEKGDSGDKPLLTEVFSVLMGHLDTLQQYESREDMILHVLSYELKNMIFKRTTEIMLEMKAEDVKKLEKSISWLSRKFVEALPTNASKSVRNELELDFCAKNMWLVFDLFTLPLQENGSQLYPDYLSKLQQQKDFYDELAKRINWIDRFKGLFGKFVASSDKKNSATIALILGDMINYANERMKKQKRIARFGVDLKTFNDQSTYGSSLDKHSADPAQGGWISQCISRGYFAYIIDILEQKVPADAPCEYNFWELFSKEPTESGKKSYELLLDKFMDLGFKHNGHSVMAEKIITRMVGYAVFAQNLDLIKKIVAFGVFKSIKIGADSTCKLDFATLEKIANQSNQYIALKGLCNTKLAPVGSSENDDFFTAKLKQYISNLSNYQGLLWHATFLGNFESVQYLLNELGMVDVKNTDKTIAGALIYGIHYGLNTTYNCEGDFSGLKFESVIKYLIEKSQGFKDVEYSLKGANYTLLTLLIHEERYLELANMLLDKNNYLNDAVIIKRSKSGWTAIDYLKNKLLGLLLKCDPQIDHVGRSIVVILTKLVERYKKIGERGMRIIKDGIESFDIVFGSANYSKYKNNAHVEKFRKVLADALSVAPAK